MSWKHELIQYITNMPGMRVGCEGGKGQKIWLKMWIEARQSLR